jgi:type I restriction enzyme R subunit
VIQELIDRAVEPIAANPNLRNRIVELRATHDRTIDEVSRDTLVEAGGMVDSTRARSIVESWQKYLEEHRSEITAIQLLTEARDRRLSFDDIQKLAERIARPPYNWTTDIIWDAYVALGTPYRAGASDRARTRHPHGPRVAAHGGDGCA